MVHMRAAGWLLAVALLSVAGCATGSPVHRSRAAPSPPATWHTAGQLLAADAGVRMAPYFVTLDFARLDTPAVVTDALTGKVTAVIWPPGGGIGFTAVSAAGDDRTFILAWQPKTPDTRFYELRLQADGRPLPVVPLRAPRVAYPDWIAVSASGTKLAIATDSRDNGVIEVDSLATGTVRVWKGAGGGVSDLSWAGNRFLAFEWWENTGPSQVHQEVRLLDTAAAGRSLLAARLVLGAPFHTRVGSFTSLDDPLISAGGSRLFADMGWRGTGDPMAEVVEFSVRTGQALAAVTPPGDESGMGSWCGAFWTDPSGTRAVVACGGFEGQTDNGHFTRADLHAPGFKDARDRFIAW